MSLRNAAKAGQRIHRERHQPGDRSHLGLLEKKKDYVLRAKDTNEKKKVLHDLHKKALNKNEDEFFHHMIRSKIKDGEHHDNEEEEKDVDSKEQKLLMDSQDVNYINMKRVIEMKKIKKIQANYHMIDAANHFRNKHTFFVDDEDDMKKFSVAKRLGVDRATLVNKTNRRVTTKEVSQKDVESADDDDSISVSKEEKVSSKANPLSVYNELKNRIIRERELSIVQNKLQIKRRLKQKGLLKPKKVKPGTKTHAPVYKFRYERKK